VSNFSPGRVPSETRIHAKKPYLIEKIEVVFKIELEKDVDMRQRP